LFTDVVGVVALLLLPARKKMTACCSLVWGVPAEKCQAIVYDMPYYNPRFNPLPPLCAPARSPFPGDYDSGRPRMHRAQRLNRLTAARAIPQQAVDARHGGTLPAVFGVASGRAAGAGAVAAAKQQQRGFLAALGRRFNRE